MPLTFHASSRSPHAKPVIALTFVFSVNAQKKKQADGLYCQIETSKGSITLALTFEETPITVANFVSLIEGKNKQVGRNCGDLDGFQSLEFEKYWRIRLEWS